MLRDPFTVEDEALLYVPRAASERVLAELEQALTRSSNPVALIGSVGIGKSVLFKVVTQRLASQACCVPVRYEGWSVAELCQWVIRELDARETLEGERALSHRPTLVKFREWMQRERSYLQKGDPETALLELAGDLQSRGFPIVLLVDDADSMKPDTAARLVELTAQTNGSLVLGLALTEGAPGAGALRGALAPGLKEIRFFEPMTLEETMSYVKDRLAKVGASRELRACLDDARIRRIYRYTEGNPRRVHGEVGLLHLELSRVRAGLPMRDSEGPRFEPPEERVPEAFPSRFEPRAPYAPVAPPAPAIEPDPAPPWRLREEEPPAPAAEPEVDETEAVLAALTPIPAPTPEPIPEPMVAEPVVAIAAPEPLASPAPSELATGLGTLEEESEELLDEIEPVLEDLAELAEDGGEVELEVVAIEEIPEPPPTEPPAAIPPTTFELLAPALPTPPVIEEEEEEPHIIAPETLASLRASAAAEEEEERERDSTPEPLPSLRVVADGDTTPNAELYAAVRRDWEDLSQRSAPLTSVTLPPPVPVEPETPRPAPERAEQPSRASWTAAAGVVLAASLALAFWLGTRPMASPPTPPPTPELASPTAEVGAAPSESAPPVEPSSTPAPAAATRPEPGPGSKPASPAGASEGAEPNMVATNINAKPWARIEIDGVDVGETPLGEFPLREGKHAFRAFLSDGRVIERTETISRSNSRILFE